MRPTIPAVVIGMDHYGEACIILQIQPLELDCRIISTRYGGIASTAPNDPMFFPHHAYVIWNLVAFPLLTQRNLGIWMPFSGVGRIFQETNGSTAAPEMQTT